MSYTVNVTEHQDASIVLPAKSFVCVTDLKVKNAQLHPRLRKY